MQKKLIFHATKSVDGLQLGKYLADFGKWGTILIVTSRLTLSMPYFTSGGHFSDRLRCSKVRQLKDAIVTIRSDQQGDRTADPFLSTVMCFWYICGKICTIISASSPFSAISTFLSTSVLTKALGRLKHLACLR
jgi:hypothetical protein